MLRRAGILDRSGLPDRGSFGIEPHRDDLGVWRIKFSHDGDPTILKSVGSAARLADEIRSVDPDFAAEIDACVEATQRYAMDPNSPPDK